MQGTTASTPDQAARWLTAYAQLEAATKEADAKLRATLGAHLENLPEYATPSPSPSQEPGTVVPTYVFPAYNRGYSSGNVNTGSQTNIYNIDNLHVATEDASTFGEDLQRQAEGRGF